MTALSTIIGGLHRAVAIGRAIAPTDANPLTNLRLLRRGGHGWPAAVGLALLCLALDLTGATARAVRCLFDADYRAEVSQAATLLDLERQLDTGDLVDRLAELDDHRHVTPADIRAGGQFTLRVDHASLVDDGPDGRGHACLRFAGAVELLLTNDFGVTRDRAATTVLVPVDGAWRSARGPLEQVSHRPGDLTLYVRGETADGGLDLREVIAELDGKRVFRAAVDLPR